MVRPQMPHAREVAEQLVKRLPQGGTLLDIGGNVGRVSEAVKALRPDVHIVLFEPIPVFADKARARLAQYPDVKVVGNGLSDTSTTMRIYRDKDNPGWSTLDATYATPDKIEYMVYVQRLDDYPLTAVDCIKMDVEYWEGYALRGARQTIDRFMPPIFMELSRGSDEPWRVRVEEMERLFSIGYRRINYNRSGRHDVWLEPEGTQ